jgi:hypothetical protein
MKNTDYQNLQQTILDLYNSTNDNIVGVGFSYKVSNNITTDRLSIQFSVAQKKQIQDLSPDEIIPKTINVNGKEYETDVIEQQLEFSINPCYSWDPPDANILMHRAVVSPLRGGVSVGPNNEINAGTLGMICVDNIDRTIIGLTNNHVIIANGFLNSTRLQYNPNSPAANTRYINSETSDMSQPGRLDALSGQRIGPIKRYYPFSSTGANYIDAAIISISSPSLIDNNSYRQLNNNELLYPPIFATTDEINSLLSLPKPKLYKSGRTTGFIGGSVCPIEAISIMETLTVSGYAPYGAAIQFSDTIIYRFVENNSAGRPMGGVSIPGDSGSAILADFNGVQKVIGLNFAAGRFASGDPQGNAGVACRIDRIASLLNIGSWNGSDMMFSNPSNWTYLEENDNGNNSTININGETYWQIGTT